MAAPTSSESPKQVDHSGGAGGGTSSAGSATSPPVKPSGSGGSVPNDDSAAASAASSTEVIAMDAAADTMEMAKEEADLSASVLQTSSTKAPPQAAATATATATLAGTAAAATANAPIFPTYESVEESELYQTALSLMKEGEFEGCIELVEQGIDELKETVAVAMSTSHGDEGGRSVDVDVHPSMAPYYYLYGTTLLYKVEEQDLNSSAVGGSALAPDDAAAAAAASSSPRGDDDDEEEEGQEYYNGGEDGGDDGGDDEGDAADKVEDLQVAWEFLESARGVLETMIASGPEGDRANKYRADLAQVRLREGDLNRINGQSQAAVADYQASLEYLAGSARVGPYDRKIADLHYNLGLLCTLEAASASAPDALPATNPVVAALVPEMPPQKVLSGRERAALRSRGVYHFWQCCKVLAGQLAILCGVDDPSEVLDRAERTVANLKSTGEGKGGDQFGGDLEGEKAEHPNIVSRKLTNLRADLALHLPNGRQQHKDSVDELVQILDDIQETIDEVERSEEGIQQVAEMKAEISAAAASAAASNAGDENDGHGFGSAAAAATSAAAQPLLAVKKKAKKRDASDAALKDDNGVSKRPAAE